MCFFIGKNADNTQECSYMLVLVFRGSLYIDIVHVLYPGVLQGLTNYCNGTSTVTTDDCILSDCLCYTLE